MPDFPSTTLKEDSLLKGIKRPDFPFGFLFKLKLSTVSYNGTHPDSPLKYSLSFNRMKLNNSGEIVDIFGNEIDLDSSSQFVDIGGTTKLMDRFYNNSNSEEAAPISKPGPSPILNHVPQFLPQPTFEPDTIEANFDFVFLGYYQYYYLTRGEINPINISGSKINLGFTRHQKDMLPNSDPSNYFTLKFESAGNSSSGKGDGSRSSAEGLPHPDIVVGMPCPPIWSPEMPSDLSDGGKKKFIASAANLYSKIMSYSKDRRN